MLLNPDQKLQIKLGGAVASAQPTGLVGYADIREDVSDFVPRSSSFALNSTTAVDVLAAPGTQFLRQLKFLSLYNADSADVGVVLQVDDASTVRRICTVTLEVGGRLEYTPEGFRVYTATGAPASDFTIDWGEIGGTLADQADLQAALDAKLDDSQLDTDGTLAANSDAKIASQKAVKTYADAKVIDSIADSDTTHAPSRNAVFDALAAKQAADQDLTDIAALSPSNDDVIQRKAGAWTNRSMAQLKTDLSLSNVTNDAQTKAAIVPNTAPSAGQILVGNAGGTAYAPVSVSGDITLTDAGVASLSKPVLFACTTTANGLVDDTSAQAIFPSANDTLTVEANTTYFFDAVIRFTNNNAASKTDAFGFGGTATFTSIGYVAEVSRVNGGTIITTGTRTWVTTAAMTVIDAAGTVSTIACIKGIVRIANAGTIIPQWQMSAAPGTPQVEPNSYIRFQKAGADTIASSGPWA